MKADSGVNPMGSFNSFVSNDPIKNIDVWRDRVPKVDVEKEFGWLKKTLPAGTTTHIFISNKVKDAKLDRTNIEIKENPRNKTDHISYNPPTSTNPTQKVFDNMLNAQRFD